METAFRVGCAAVGVLIAASVAGVLGWIFLFQPTPVYGLDPAQRATPTTVTIEGVVMIVQRTDGFAMPVIDGLSYVPEDAVIAGLFAQQPLAAEHWAAWRWSTPSQLPMLMVVLDVEPIFAPDARETYLAGVIEGVESTPLPEGFAPYVHESTSPLDHTFRALAADGTGGMFIRVFGYEHGGSFIVASVTVAGADLASLEVAVRGARPID